MSEKSEKKAMSIKDLAAMAGVSSATVSRVLNGSGRYSKETAERVLEIARATGFTPNMVARGLRVKQMNNIGVIAPDLTNEFFAKLVSNIQRGLFNEGYHAFICDANEDPIMERRHLDALKRQNVAGVIYVGSGDMADAPTLPTTFIDRAPRFAHKPDNCLEVASDNESGGYLAAEHLIKRGCKRLVMLADERRLSSQQDRINGFIAAHGAYGLPVTNRNVVDLNEISFAAAYEAISAMLADGLSFDGVFASTDWLAVGAFAALRERGFNVPGDVKIVGHDDVSIALYNAVPITTVRQDVAAIAKAAVDGLLALIKGEPFERKTKIPVELIVRETA